MAVEGGGEEIRAVFSSFLLSTSSAHQFIYQHKRGHVTFNGIKISSIFLVNYVKDTGLSTSTCRRGSTPVSTVLRKSLTKDFS